MSNCIICFSDFEQGKKYKCCHPDCTEYICFDCLKRYIEIAHQENSLPTCPREKCTGVFDEQTIPKELVEMFHDLLWNHFTLVKTGEISESRKAIVLRDILKEEKMKFMVDSMPEAVKLVAKLAFMGRIRKIKKLQEGRDTARVSRTCINLVCNGFLDETFTCTKCKVAFCKDCEVEKTEEHVCNKDDVESLKAVNAMVSCPNCKTKIEKAEGCMAITCAVCNTNFWYNTGEKGDHGNHGQFVGVRLREMRISNEYRDRIPGEYIAYIRELETNVVSSRTTKWKDQFDSMLVRGVVNHHKFSGLYSEIVRNEINDVMAAKKLATLEKILHKCEPGYEAQIAQLFHDERKVAVARVLSTTDKTTLIVDDNTTVFDNMLAAMAKMKVSSIDVRKAIEHNSGVYNGFHWSYVVE